MIVLFDAVGTVIKPEPDVTEIYHRLGLKYGSSLSPEQIKHRIKLGRRRFFNVGQSAESLFAGVHSFSSDHDDLDSSEAIERLLWQDLVFEVFVDLDQPQALFDELWEHFRAPTNWELYSDVEPCLEGLSSAGIEFGLVSNFDSRLVDIADSVFPLSNCSYVFCSSQVGFRKPSPMFYRQVEEAIQCATGNSDTDIVMVGDDFENDCVAPRLAGWKALWLNRQDLTPGSEHSFGSPEKREVSSLYEFSHWLLSQV